MKTISIIAEYNPFHNGHAWQIAEAKRRTSADFALIVSCRRKFISEGTASGP